MPFSELCIQCLTNSDQACTALNKKYYARHVLEIEIRIRLLRPNSFDAMSFRILHIGHCICFSMFLTSNFFIVFLQLKFVAYNMIHRIYFRYRTFELYRRLGRYLLRFKYIWHWNFPHQRRRPLHGYVPIFYQKTR